jgi:SAM-dependent methyltransferase
MNGRRGSPWTDPGMVAGFARSAPNAALMQLAAAEHRRSTAPRRAIDLGCGAGRNAVPLAALGWDVFGIDDSRPMLDAAQRRAAADAPHGSVHLALAGMDRLPARDRLFALVVAHGIWNLARSGDEFRRGVQEAGRVAAPGAALFVFTFSRTTLPAEAEPVAGEAFVYTQFSGAPQCFLTEAQLIAELQAGGFAPDASLPLRELNRPTGRELQAPQVPVIFEGIFRRRA